MGRVNSNGGIFWEFFQNNEGGPKGGGILAGSGIQAGGQRPPWERDLQALAGMGKLRAWSVNLPRRAPP